MWREHRKLLRFRWDDQLYQFQCLTIRTMQAVAPAIQAVAPDPLCYRNLQRLKNVAFKGTQDFESRIPPDSCAMEELQWWIAEIRMWNGKPIVSPVMQFGCNHGQAAGLPHVLCTYALRARTYYDPAH